MINFKKQIFALAYLSFLCNLIYSDPVDNNSNFDAPKQNYKKHSCDFKSCDNKRSRDCCKKHKKDVKSYEKKLGIIRGSVGFSPALNATYSVATSPVPNTNNYEIIGTPKDPNIKLVKKGKCFKTDGFTIAGGYIYKPFLPDVDQIVIITVFNIKFKKKFKDIPSITLSEQFAEPYNPVTLATAAAPLTPYCLNTSVTEDYSANITTTGFDLYTFTIFQVPRFKGSPNSITISPEAQEVINSYIALKTKNVSFIAVGEFCD